MVAATLGAPDGTDSFNRWLFRRFAVEVLIVGLRVVVRTVCQVANNCPGFAKNLRWRSLEVFARCSHSVTCKHLHRDAASRTTPQSRRPRRKAPRLFRSVAGGGMCSEDFPAIPQYSRP